jgi:NADH:ubiquinone oxidoreductase subunit 3 (subunit A)
MSVQGLSESKEKILLLKSFYLAIALSIVLGLIILYLSIIAVIKDDSRLIPLIKVPFLIFVILI